MLGLRGRFWRGFLYPAGVASVACVAELQAERDRMGELLRAALDRPTWLERLARVLRGAGKPDAGPRVLE